MRHPAEYFIKYLILSNPGMDDNFITRRVEEWGFLRQLDENYLPFLRDSIEPPDDFDPSDRTHRPSMSYLRSEKVYYLFYPSASTEEAWEILSDPDKRLVVEQALMARLSPKVIASRINQKRGWHLTAAGVSAFQHFFWNVKLLTFDEWGRYLYGRTSMYERHMALLQGSPQLALYHLRLEQELDSKQMIHRAQEICHFTLEEVAQLPGVSQQKVKGVTTLTKAIVECHNALSTSDMALKDVLAKFDKFRMEHPARPPKAIDEVAPNGNFSASGFGEGAEDD